MDEDMQGFVAGVITSFIGCLSALMVFALIIIMVTPFFVGVAVEQVKTSALQEAKSLTLECTEAYMAGSLTVSVFGVTQYCKLSPKKSFAIDFNTPIEVE